MKKRRSNLDSEQQVFFVLGLSAKHFVKKVSEGSTGGNLETGQDLKI